MIAQDDALHFLTICPEYDYVFLSPSDFGQLQFKGSVVYPDTKGIQTYKHFITLLVNRLNPKSGYVSCVITDRKHDGKIISRVNMFVDEFLSQGWQIHTRKIWAHSLKTNLYRLTFSEVITFCKKPKHASTPTAEFRPDVWLIEAPKVDKDISHHGVIPLGLLSRLICTYTKKEDVVLDPFCGSGTTLLVANELDRNSIGCEIDAKMYSLAQNNLQGVL